MPTEQLADNLGATHVVDTASTLGRGGAGVVCRFVKSDLSATHCAKLYERSLRNQQLRNKVEHMTLNPPKALLGGTYSLAWPTHSLFTRQGAFVGFAMPKAPLGSVQLYEVSTLKLSQKLPQSWRKFDRGASDAVTIRAKVCANLAIAIHRIHESGQYCLGDLKPQNILLSPDGKTCVVDLDSLQISRNGRVVFPAHLVTPEYSPPEAKAHSPGEAISVQWDLFSLAVCLYEILIGVHPYAASARAQGIAADTLQGKIAQHLFVHGPNASLLSSIPAPHALFTRLPRPIQQLFIEAFAIPVRSIARPSAERWFEELSKSIASDGFKSIRPPNQGSSPAKSTAGNRGVPTSRPAQVPRPTVQRARKQNDEDMIWRTLTIGLAIVAAILLYALYNRGDRLQQLEARIGTQQSEMSMTAQQQQMQLGEAQRQVAFADNELIQTRSRLDSLMMLHSLDVTNIIARNIGYFGDTSATDVTFLTTTQAHEVLIGASIESNRTYAEDITVQFRVYAPSGEQYGWPGGANGYSGFANITVYPGIGHRSTAYLGHLTFDCRQGCNVGEYRIEVFVNDQLKSTRSFVVISELR